MKTQRLTPGRDSLTGRIALEGRMVHIVDVLADPRIQASGLTETRPLANYARCPIATRGWPTSLSTMMSPPIIWQNRRLIARPRPNTVTERPHRRRAGTSAAFS
jgi:hypothetical protein